MALPFGEFCFGLALDVSRLRSRFIQGRQLRLTIAQRRTQGFDLLPIGADVFAEFREGTFGFLARTFQTFAQLAVVLDLLLHARDLAADAVDLGLHLVQVLAGDLMLLAMGLDLRLDLALIGDKPLDADFGLAQRRAMLIHLSGNGAIVQAAHFRLAPGLFGFQILPARGGLGLTIQVLKLLIHFLAHIVEAFEIFARGLDPAFGFLAPLLVLGDARRFFQIPTQFIRMCRDDLRDHALLDDRVAARAQTGAEEQIGDVAAAATPAVEEIL